MPATHKYISMQHCGVSRARPLSQERLREARLTVGGLRCQVFNAFSHSSIFFLSDQRYLSHNTMKFNIITATHMTTTSDDDDDDKMFYFGDHDEADEPHRQTHDDNDAQMVDGDRTRLRIPAGGDIARRQGVRGQQLDPIGGIDFIPARRQPGLHVGIDDPCRSARGRRRIGRRSATAHGLPQRV